MKGLAWMVKAVPHCIMTLVCATEDLYPQGEENRLGERSWYDSISVGIQCGNRISRLLGHPTDLVAVLT